MKGHPVSYQDPTYDNLDERVTAKLGLPDGLLASVRTKGERSNADQVSEKGARTVYQVTPATRRLVLNKYGVDAYLSPENAAEAAGLLLKEGLDRNGGDTRAAVAEYHGGTDPANHGPKTKAYVARVAGAGGQSTFDRVKAQMQGDEAPSIAQVYDAYKAGKLTPQQKADFEQDVNAGAVILPSGGQLLTKPDSVTLPSGVVSAYTNHSEMNDGERDQLDKDLAAGVVKLPKGAILKRPAPRSAGENIGMGARGVLEGAGGLVDIPVNAAIAAGNLAYKPIGAVTEALGGTAEPDLPYNQFRGAASTVSDAMGLAKPATEQEKLGNAIVEGGTQGLLTAGAGLTASGARGATGLVARELAANPATDIAASAVGSGAMEKARQEGVGPIGQLAIGVAAGGVAGVGTKAAARVAERFGPGAAKVVQAVPREAVLDAKGALTDEGRELAAQHDLTPEQVKGAYDEADAASKPPADVPEDDHLGRTFFSTENRAPVGAGVPDPKAKLEAAGIQGVNITGHDPAFGPVIEGADFATARRALEALGDGEAKGVLQHPALEDPVDLIWGNEKGGWAHVVADHDGQIGDDFADEFSKMEVINASPNRVRLQSADHKAVVRLDYDGKRKSWLMTAFERDDRPGGKRTETAPQDGSGHSPSRPTEQNIAPEGGAPKPEAAAAPEAPLPASAAERATQAQSEGVDLTRGQATKDFAVQSAENDLAGTQTPEGQKVREHFTKQAEQIKTAVDRFKSAFGDTSLGATERGQAVKDAIRDLRDQGKAGVSALYGQAREAAEQLGEQGSNLIQLDTAPVLQRMREMFIDEGVDDGVRRALKQQAAKYGLIGESPKTVEGETTVQLRDQNGEPSGKITFTGPPQRLTIANAEDFRRAISGLYEAGKRNQQEALKPLIDKAVGDAVERAATDAPSGVGKAFKDARAAHVEQQKTFKSGDVVQDLIDWKKGQKGTEKINPEEIFARIFKGGPEGLTNLKKVKAVLLNKPTETSRAAWQAIQAHGVAQVFAKATVTNANLGEAGLGAISGAKLNSEIARFGADKLKVLLAPEDFNQLMKLRRVIGDATIPLKGTTNPSGSGHVMARFLAKQAVALAPVAKIVPVLRDVVKGAEEFAERKATKQTVEGVTSFTPEAAANADVPKAKADPLAFIRRYISIAGSDQIIAPLIASAANEERP